MEEEKMKGYDYKCLSEIVDIDPFILGNYIDLVTIARELIEDTENEACKRALAQTMTIMIENGNRENIKHKIAADYILKILKSELYIGDAAASICYMLKGDNYC